MLEGGDTKGSDYIDRLHRLLPFVLSLIDDGNQHALCSAYANMLELQWLYSQKDSESRVFSELHTVGSHAQKAGLVEGMIECYYTHLLPLVLSKKDGKTGRTVARCSPLVSTIYIWGFGFKDLPLFLILLLALFES
jgi:hypothetical protein